MDLSDKEKFGLGKRSRDQMSYQSPGLSPDWQYGNPSIDPSTAVAGSSPCPSVSMVESFCPTLWNHPAASQSLGFSEANASSSAVPVGKPVMMPNRLDMGGVFLQSLSQFPADSAFIERAARFSSFNGATYSAMVNPFGTPESLSPYSSTSRGANAAQMLDDVSVPADHGSNSRSPMNEQRDKGSLHGGVGGSNNDSGEPEFSGSGQEETPNLGSAAGDSSYKGLSANKRKRANQDIESDQVEGTQQLSIEAAKENADTKQKGEQNSSTLATVKASGKQVKDSSDSPKEDYIHVRARRGQATNSHSLAERVRREKISERMKYLQDLVPGCSKVTGKAVMLDEIINYVQSLQRQVEFLSMKLAAVNPRLDFNIEGLLSKDFLQSRGVPSSTMGFTHDMMHPQLHLPPQSLIQAGMPGMAHPSDALRRAINAQITMINGYKEPTHQIPGTWDDELNNVIQMNFGTSNPPPNTQ